MALVSRADKALPNIKKQILYTDIFTSAMFNVDTRDVQLAENEDAVKQSILNILLTNRGERFFNYNFGSDIKKILFENMTPQTSSMLVEFIKSSIENFEPRANLLDVKVNPYYDDNAYTVTIVFNVINKTEPVTLEFLLNRVR